MAFYCLRNPRLRENYVQIPQIPLSHYVTLGNALLISKIQFPDLWNKDLSTFKSVKWFSGKTKQMWLAYCLANSFFLILVCQIQKPNKYKSWGKGDNKSTLTCFFYLRGGNSYAWDRMGHEKPPAWNGFPSCPVNGLEVPILHFQLNKGNQVTF